MIVYQDVYKDGKIGAPTRTDFTSLAEAADDELASYGSSGYDVSAKFDEENNRVDIIAGDVFVRRYTRVSDDFPFGNDPKITELQQ